VVQRGIVNEEEGMRHVTSPGRECGPDQLPKGVEQ
jgi:hypothetical protein